MNTPAVALADEDVQPKLREFLLYFLRLGSYGFGGPIALAAYMQKNLVEERKWVSSQDYVEGLAFAQLSPGPLAAQLAMYLGWVQAGRHQLTYGSGKERRFTYNFFERFGEYYGGKLNEFRVQANYRPTTKFSISASETWDRFRLPLTNGNFSVLLASGQGNYSFTRFLTFTSLLQLDTSNTQAMSANVRLRYNYRPDSDLYVIYNVGTQFASIAPANPPQVRETRFAVKYTYSFAP